jgi:hypothetical protein
MAGIVEYLQQILSARYGRDVRQAIHDGIQQCYYDGKAGGVDLEARQDIEKMEAATAEVKQDIEGLEENLANYISRDDVVDDLTSTETQKPLSANRGRELRDGISKVNPLETIYIMETNIDDVLNSTTPQYPNIFGHSDALSSIGIGYWVIVETTAIGDYISQKAIGEGGMATRWHNSGVGWTPWNVTAKKNDVCWIKTITATTNSNGLVLIGNDETPLSVVCDTDGYYVGRLFKNQYGLWYATIFDVATVQAVTSEIGVTLYATMKP